MRFFDYRLLNYLVSTKKNHTGYLPLLAELELPHPDPAHHASRAAVVDLDDHNGQRKGKPGSAFVGWSELDWIACSCFLGMVFSLGYLFCLIVYLCASTAVGLAAACIAIHINQHVIISK
jgi:hypothetical protein